MSVKFFPTPIKVGPFKASAEKPPMASTTTNGKTLQRDAKPWTRSKANKRKNPRPAEKKAHKERVAMLTKRFARNKAKTESEG